MSCAKLVNIARLMTTYNFEIEQLPDNLKCAQCKLVLKDACQLPCYCSFCRVCILNMMAEGGEFCPGESENCGESLLSCFVSDYLTNKNVSRLSVKCPHDGCVHECQLASMEEHLRECQRKSGECPFRELGCTQNKLAVEEMGGHLQHENRRHSEILVAIIANNNREIEMLKHELMLKDGQIRSIIDQMIHVQNENKSIKNDIKSMKEEKEDLAGQVRILSEKIERPAAERHENDELDSARVVEHVDKEIAAVKLLIGSNKSELDTDIQSVKDDIGSINQGFQSMNSQVQSVQVPVTLGQVDASFVWLIDDDIYKTRWKWRESEYFSGVVHPYKYRLKSANYNTGTAGAALRIQLHIYAGPNDGQLVWPFQAKVVITVTDRDRHEACRSISGQCRIERPLNIIYKSCDEVQFLYSDLREARLNLSHGVRVCCVIVPGAG